MHEAGIAEDLIKSIQQKLETVGDIKEIKTIYIRLGKAMGITEESLGFWFSNMSKGTKLEGASLDISLVDGRELVVDSVEAEKEGDG